MRLYIPSSFLEKKPLSLTEPQSHYLISVLRKKTGDSIKIFNGTQGEWTADLHQSGKKTMEVIPLSLSRPQPSPSSLTLVVAPIKRQDFVVEKATELGVGDIMPVLTERTVVRQIKPEKWQAWAIEAAEQSERLSIPLIHPLTSLEKILQNWPSSRKLLWCRERSSENPSPLTVLSNLGQDLKTAGILIGPEGGFSEKEQLLLSQCNFILPFSLGGFILRAETAAITALALVQGSLSL